MAMWPLPQIQDYHPAEASHPAFQGPVPVKPMYSSPHEANVLPSTYFFSFKKREEAFLLYTKETTWLTSHSFPSPSGTHSLSFLPLLFCHARHHDSLCPSVSWRSSCFQKTIFWLVKSKCFFKDRIYLFVREGAPAGGNGRKREKQVPHWGKTGCGTGSQSSGILTWAKGGYLTD